MSEYLVKVYRGEALVARFVTIGSYQSAMRAGFIRAELANGDDVVAIKL